MAFQVGKRSEVIEQNTSTAAGFGFKAALGGSDGGEFRAKGRAVLLIASTMHSLTVSHDSVAGG